MIFMATGLTGRRVRASGIRELPFMLLAMVVIAGLCSGAPARADDAAPAVSSAPAPSGIKGADGATANKPKAHPSRKVSPYRTASVPNGARLFYLSIWGIDNLLVHQTASGSLIRFSYRVVNPVRAKLMGDKRATPYMFGVRSRALLHIPVMEQVGPLRQSVDPKAGKEYWMVFSNKGSFVRVGDRVNVIIGTVHVDGLLVE